MGKYIAIIILTLLAGCQGADDGIPVASEDITLTATDGTNIKGTYYRGSEKGIILIHMLGRDRRDWDTFARTLQGKGYSVVSIDLRGHGESDLDVRDFSPNDFNNMVLDAEAAVDHLEKNGVSDISLIGASIGANIALNYAAGDEEVGCAVLLSPGLDYRGVHTEGDAASYGLRPLLIVASAEDGYSAASSTALYEEALGFKRIEMYQGAGHGTQMFSNPDLEPFLMGWLKDECYG